ncbi:MAG: AAA family ATPase [Erysipelotrichaceae bacterium]|jgi:AAA+ ATPase superfamily predicted ATPase|nr:AAA family ATPase [Erysipelotrichaceae bacterium]
MEIIGRKKERFILERCEQSGKPEFVAVYGRRRVGKTYLVVEHFANKFAFSITGTASGKKADQLREFHYALQKHYQGDIQLPKDWSEAFHLLQQQIEKDVTLGRKVLFFDELPWLDTPKSGFLTALEHFWNAFASRREDIMLIVCGSAASWMIRNLIDNYGGLHNRVTQTIAVEPFTLSECEAFYQSRGIAYNRRQIAEAYMILGGIPYYMGLMDRMYGLNQNIDYLLFEKNAKLAREFERLYHSLFRYAQTHIRVVETLAEHGSGLARKELSKQSGISDGGGLTKVLSELEACGIISRSYDIVRKRNREYYKCVDFFTLFYIKFLKGKKETDPHFWTNYLSDPAHRGWCGYAFERLCLAHIAQIKQKLGISGVITSIYTFRSDQKKGGAQIDLVIDRKDETINLCECKYTILPYEVDEKDAADWERKKEVFIQDTGTRKAIHMTLISASGAASSPWQNDIQSVITLDDLFKEVE